MILDQIRVTQKLMCLATFRTAPYEGLQVELGVGGWRAWTKTQFLFGDGAHRSGHGC